MSVDKGNALGSILKSYSIFEIAKSSIGDFSVLGEGMPRPVSPALPFEKISW